MPNYQRKTLATGADIGEPGPLPEDLVGFEDSTLADLSGDLSAAFCEAAGYVGQGFFPVPDPESEPELRRTPRVRFIQRIPIAKRAGIVVSEDPLVKAFLFTLQATETVELDNEDTVAGVAYLVAQDLLTQDEAKTLLA